MSLKDILVFLNEGSTGEGRFRLAMKIARSHEACLSAVFIQNDNAINSPRSLAAPWLGLAAGPPISGAIVTSRSA
jgi:hypothetical protein